MLNFFKTFFENKTNAIGLSVFRISYIIILFCEILQLFKFRHIIYDKDPFVYVGEIDVAFLFYFWFLVLVFLFFGLFTRVSAIINYIFSVIIFSSASHFEYHVFYAYIGINFLLMFMPVSRVFSLDSLIKKLKYAQIGKSYKVDRAVLEINYLGPVFIAIGLVYFDSVFHKFSSKLWMDGLGVWLPSSLPMVTCTDTSFLLNQEVLVKLLGYLVLVFETVFVFLFWFKKWRIPLLLLGIFFHLGILITYPIPWFALTAVATYLLLVPQIFWSKISNAIKFKKHLYTFYYDAECPLCNKVIVVIKHFDVFNTIKCLTVQGNYLNDETLKNYDEQALLINIHGVASNGKVSVGYWAYLQLFKSLLYTYPLGMLGSVPGISFLGQKIYRYVAGNRLTERCTAENCTLPVYNEPISETQDVLVKGWNQLAITRNFWKIILMFFFFMQCLMIWFSPSFQNVIPAKERLNRIVSIPYKNSKWMLNKYFGISHHAVFLDQHFNGYNHIVKVVSVKDQKRTEVPIINGNGMPGEYDFGSLWCNISFKVITTNIEKDKIQIGLTPYLKYYNNVNKLTTNEFEFYIKEIEIPKEWQKDFLKKQMIKPWIKVGSCTISKESTIFHWNERMEEILKKEADEK